MVVENGEGVEPVAGDKRLEQQLEYFYAHVPDVGDPLPLKDYLLKHEHNQMAWYLLGKMYENRGEHGKASYCYRLAGTVYEAYENKPAPRTVAERQTGRMRRHRGATAVLAVLAIVLLALGTGSDRIGTPAETESVRTWPLPGVRSAGAAGDGSFVGAVGEPAAAPAVKPGGKPDAAAMAADADRAGGFAAVAGVTGNTDPAGWLTGLLRHAAAGAPSLLVRAPLLGAWIDWVGSGAPVAAASAGDDPGTAVWTWFDPAWCGGCDVGAGMDRARVEAWKALQEYKLALRAAAIAYRERTGRWPETPESLTGAYPDNVLAGWAPEMTDWFAALQAVQADGRLPAVAGWPGDEGAAAGRGWPLGAFAPLTAERPEIVVDKTNHRLAVVVGNILLRNYEVGLGGDRTPEGTFTITEKVRNPNGRADGEYGSRGLVLSGSAYAIHGTNDPDSIGKDESLGCIRMAKEDLEELYDLVPLGTRVTIVKEGLPAELRVPPDRFRLAPAQAETNPGRIYRWLA